MTAEISSILSGADYVMLGGMLANHDESEGAIVKENDRDFMLFYGMSSSTAIDKHYGGVADYRASEGKTVRVPYRGAVDSSIEGYPWWCTIGLYLCRRGEAQGIKPPNNIHPGDGEGEYHGREGFG